MIGTAFTFVIRCTGGSGLQSPDHILTDAGTGSQVSSNKLALTEPVLRVVFRMIEILGRFNLRFPSATMNSQLDSPWSRLGLVHGKPSLSWYFILELSANTILRANHSLTLQSFFSKLRTPQLRKIHLIMIGGWTLSAPPINCFFYKHGPILAIALEFW